MSTTMASFLETGEALLLAFDEDLINDKEFVLLYQLALTELHPDILLY